MPSNHEYDSGEFDHLAKAKWKISIEIEGEADRRPMQMAISESDIWSNHSGLRAVDECIASSMARLLGMLLSSGHLFCPSGESAVAFTEVMDAIAARDDKCQSSP